MTEYRIGCGDPGGQADRFGFDLLRVIRTREIRKIFIMGAHAWRFKDGMVDYNTVEQSIAQLHRKKPFDKFVCEKNNTGIHVIATLKRVYHIPIYGIYTSKNLKSIQTIRKGETMDKNEHISWINKERQAGRIVFPNKMTDGLRNLKGEMDSFVKKFKGTGYVFEAEGTAKTGFRHDDLVLAFLVGTYYIRRKIFGDLGVVKRDILNKKFQPKPIEDNLGTGLSEGQILIGSSTIMPSGHIGYR